MQKLLKKALYLSVVPALFFSSCSDDDDTASTPTLQIPNEYVSPDFAANAAAEIALTDELEAFTNAQKAADSGNVVTLTSLTTLWTGTDLKSATVQNYHATVDAELPLLATASAAGTYDWSTAPNNDGGHFEGRVFNARGLESVQLVEKGLFGAALFYQAQQRVSALGENITAADVDGLVALFGTTPAFPNTDVSGPNSDKFQAKYAARRTPASGGLYLDMKRYFIEARTYAEAGAAYNAQKMLAVQNLMQAWEESLAATTINYLFTTVDKLSQTNPDDATLEDGMHAYAEGVGFLSGVLAVPANFRIIPTAQAEDALVNMLAPFGQEPSSYLLVQSPATELPKLQAALNTLQQVYGFTDAEMEGFKKNHVNEEGR